MIWRILLALATLTVAMPAAAAPPSVRALFVGIDRYRYSQTRVEGAEFRDLRGAVGDSVRFKEAIRAAYGLDLDRTVAKRCKSSNNVSITLTDDCATRAAMLAALADLITRSAAGDTLLFYYAGHGSQIVAGEEFDTASRYYQTILPSDARDPDAPATGEILDKELRGYIDQAAAKGVNVVTVFDSCNSATATRGQRIRKGATPLADLGEARFAGVLNPAAIKRPAPPPTVGPGGGYRVHLAASRDDQQAREAPQVKGGTDRRGLFTTALIDAIRRSPQSTFGDLILGVSEQVNDATDGRQTPRGEGALNATLGGPDRPIPLFDVRFDANDRPVLGAGRLSGITEGSTFALFATFADALREGAKPLAVATAGVPDNGGAPLTVAGPPAALPTQMVARELTHVWGNGIVPVFNSVISDNYEAVAEALSRIPLVTEGNNRARARYTLVEAADGLLAIDGPGVTLPLGKLDAGFGDRLDEIIRKIARVESLLALANSPPGDQLCLAEGEYDPPACPPLTQGPVRQVGLNAPLTLTAANKNPEGAERYLYVLLVDQAYGITLILPRNRGVDDRVPADKPQTRKLTLTDPGTYRLIAIASDVRIQPAALEQTGVGARDGPAEAANGWTASVSEVIVARGK